MNINNLIQTLSIQLNFIFVVVIYVQQTQIKSLNNKLEELSYKIDNYYDEIEKIKIINEKIINDNIVNNSNQFTNYINFDSGSKIFLLFSSLLVLIKIIKIIKSTLFFINSLKSLNLLPFIVTKSKLFSYIFNKNEVIEFVDNNFFYQIMFKNNEIININIKDNPENSYEDLSTYILRILKELNIIKSEKIVNNSTNKEILNNFIAAIDGF
jgi:hypothetical protein